jgi:hypothetical protein
MAGMRMSMRKIREVLRLTHALGVSVRQVKGRIARLAASVAGFERNPAA